MHTNYNINQTTLCISTEYIPEKNNTAHYINDLVESLQLAEPYLFGRPRKYDLSVLLKLVLFAYTRGVFTSRKIEQLAEENLPARWLTQEQVPSYRTIAQFRTSNDIEELLDKGLDALVIHLRKQQLLDDAIFIDGTKILADANKYSFVWKKSTIKFDKMNREKIVELMIELKEAHLSNQVPDGTNLTLDMLDEVLTRLEIQLEELDKEVEKTKKIAPNPAKKIRRTLKSKRRNLILKRDKMADHQQRITICGQRNSYSKTDNDATFMRVKEDHMMNGQLKPAYNLQLATSNQFIVGYDVFQNPTDTKTLIPFLNKLKKGPFLPKYIVADAGYGSEPNYRYLEDNFSKHLALIPYGTMLREQSKTWKTDERKVMNWKYYEEEDYYVDPKGVRFSFNSYRKRADKEGFIRDFKEYIAEKYDNNNQVIESALTPKGYVRKINVNPSWEYFKEKQKEQLSSPETSKVYSQRKIDVESVFGWMKASLGFTRYHVRGLEKVRKETGLLIMALNIRKLEITMRKKKEVLYQKGIKSELSKRLILLMPFIHYFRDLCHSPFRLYTTLYDLGPILIFF